MAVKPPPVRKRRRRRTKKRRKRRRRRAKSADAAQKAAQKAPTPPPPAAVLQAVRTRSDGRQGAQRGSEGAETAPNDGRRVCKRRPAAIQAAAHSVHQRTEFKAFGALDGILTGCDGMKAAVGGVKKGERAKRQTPTPPQRGAAASRRPGLDPSRRRLVRRRLSGGDLSFGGGGDGGSDRGPSRALHCARSHRLDAIILLRRNSDVTAKEQKKNTNTAQREGAAPADGKAARVVRCMDYKINRNEFV